MAIYVLNLFLLLFFALVLLYRKDPPKKGRLIFCVIGTVNWTLLSGLRHISIGTDTRNYKKIFLSDIQMEWSTIWDEMISFIKGEDYRIEPGYRMFEKLCGTISEDYQFFLMIVAIVFTVSLGYSIYKNSSDPFISFALYSCLFYAFFAITGQRQTIATAIGVFIGYEFCKKRKLIPFVICVLIAATMHRSVLIFLIMYPLYNLKFDKKNVFFMLILIAGAFVFSESFYDVVQSASGYEYNEYTESGVGYTFILLLCSVVAMAFLIRDRLTSSSEVNPQTQHYVVAAELATGFCPLMIYNPSAMRVVQYFSVFLMFLIPEYVKVFEKRERVYAWMIFFVVLFVLFINGTAGVYRFYWQ